jgi:molybdenum cofactor biosynthesis enzyme MoaA
VSVTDRCNIRCFYCMPETDVKFERREQLLSFEEIERFVSIAARLGVRKVRLTGGEPLVRKNLSTLVRKLGAIEGIEDLALTTNGVLLADHIIEMLEREIGPLEEIPDCDQRAPATEYRFADGIGRVGFIASVSRPFCLNCNRLRITADGHLRYCLFAMEETDIRALLRGNASEEEIAAAIVGCVRGKWLGHEINSTRFVAPPRPMYSIGG